MSTQAVGSVGSKRGRSRRRLAGGAAVVTLGLLVPSACRDMDSHSELMGPGDLTPMATFSVTSTGHAYTLNADFDEGTLVSLNHDAPNGNQLQLNATSGTFPFIWVALSQRCTIAKVNTETGAILGEYRTLSDQHGFCPESSRTTVGVDGSVWVGHRGQGGVAHVGLRELNQCIDRNGSGTIETSSGYGDVRPWPGSDSNVASAQDECILHHVDTDPLGFGDTRHMSIDANNKLWVGAFFGRRFVRVDGTSGVIETAPKLVACGGYGGLIDSNGVIWSANGGGAGLLRWDPDAPDVPGVNPRCINIPVYGLAIDQNGWVWANEFGINVRKVSPDGNTILGPFLNGAHLSTFQSQGLAVDANGDVWVSSGLSCSFNCTIGHLKNDGTFVGNVPNPTGSGSTGISVDANGKIWSANRLSHTATRINPALGPVGGAGTTVGAVDLTVSFPATAGRPLPFPYNYSDMTGAQLFGSTAPQGSWTVVQNGGSAGVEWGTITWNTEAQGFVPAGGSITVEARTADSEAGLGGQAFHPVTNGVPFTQTGQFIQVRVTLRAAPDGRSPVLSDLRIQAASSDQTPPICMLSGQGTDANGRKYIQVTTRDPLSGLASILVTKATNLNAVVPAFTPGTTSNVVVTATKINQTQSSQLALRVRDVAGNVINCDPIDVTVWRASGKPETTTFTALPQSEHWIDVTNGEPGLTNLAITVNNTKFQVAGLGDGEVRTLNVASAMRPGSDNVISLEPRGQPGGSAWVLIRD